MGQEGDSRSAPGRPYPPGIHPGGKTFSSIFFIVSLQIVHCKLYVSLLLNSAFKTFEVTACIGLLIQIVLNWQTTSALTYFPQVKRCGQFLDVYYACYFIVRSIKQPVRSFCLIIVFSSSPFLAFFTQRAGDTQASYSLFTCAKLKKNKKDPKLWNGHTLTNQQALLLFQIESGGDLAPVRSVKGQVQGPPVPLGCCLGDVMSSQSSWIMHREPFIAAAPLATPRLPAAIRDSHSLPHCASLKLPMPFCQRVF